MKKQCKDRKRSEGGGENVLHRVRLILLLEFVLEGKGRSSLSYGDKTTHQKIQHRNSRQEFFPREGVNAYNQKSNQVNTEATLTKEELQKIPSVEPPTSIT